MKKLNAIIKDLKHQLTFEPADTINWDYFISLAESAKKETNIINSEMTTEDYAKLIQAGYKILAIKLYRQFNNCDLYRAKEMIDEINNKMKNFCLSKTEKVAIHHKYRNLLH